MILVAGQGLPLFEEFRHLSAHFLRRKNAIEFPLQAPFRGLFYAPMPLA